MNTGPDLPKASESIKAHCRRKPVLQRRVTLLPDGPRDPSMVLPYKRGLDPDDSSPHQPKNAYSLPADQTVPFDAELASLIGCSDLHKGVFAKEGTTSSFRKNSSKKKGSDWGKKSGCSRGRASSTTPDVVPVVSVAKSASQAGVAGQYCPPPHNHHEVSLLELPWLPLSCGSSLPQEDCETILS